MKNILFLIVVLLAGCSASEEDSQINLAKGDEFFAKEEYEVAEYYYERIPEESPLYAQAEKKLVAIHEIKAQWMDRTVSEEDLTRLLIIDLSSGTDNVLNIPAHRLLIRNNNKRDIASVKLEFTYFDEQGEVIGHLQTDVPITIKANDQNECVGVNPGRLDRKFTKASAQIIGAMYQ
ncbi:MAG: FxLYD domain-containing protein [Bacteroidota bacterium]|jgi:uncharacterized protein YcfL